MCTCYINISSLVHVHTQITLQAFTYTSIHVNIPITSYPCTVQTWIGNIQCWYIMCTWTHYSGFHWTTIAHWKSRHGQIEFPILLPNSRKLSGTRSNSSSSIHVRNQSPRPFADLTWASSTAAAEFLRHLLHSVWQWGLALHLWAWKSHTPFGLNMSMGWYMQLWMSVVVRLLDLSVRD